MAFLMKSSRMVDQKQDEEAPPSPQGSVYLNDLKSEVAQTKMAVVCYDTKKLTGFGALLHVKGTVWANASLWKIMGSVLLLSFCVGFIIFLFVPDPSSIDASKFLKISSFLKVFVAFLLGVFMASSVSRWTETVDGFLELFAAIRDLSLQLTCLGVENDRVRHILRYSIASGMFLVTDLENAADKRPDKEDRMQRSWISLTSTGVLDAEEQQILEPLRDRALLIWMWVASLISRLAQDELIPPMNTPTYGRIMTLCQVAQRGVGKVRASISVQIPYIYTHMLATLVHVNNLLCALTFGLTLGSSIGAILGKFNIHSPLIPLLYPHSITKGSNGAQVSTMSSAQSIIMGMLTCLIAPFMYQAFLQIALAFAQPFGSAEAAIPTEMLIHNLKRDLEQMELLGCNVPSWEIARFGKNKPHVASTSAASASAASSASTSEISSRPRKANVA